MPVFNDAGRALRRNWTWAAIYTAASSAVSTLSALCSVWTESVTVDKQVPAVASAVGLISDVAGSAIMAAALAWCFAEMGKEMDRPLWKCEGAREALSRYFVLWLILVLATIANTQLQTQAFHAENRGVVELLEYSRLMLIMLVVPIGACLMYHRGPGKEHFIAAFSPFVRLPGPTIGVLVVGMLQWLLMQLMIIGMPEELRDAWWIYAPINVPFALIDCYVFCAVWHICILDRNMQSEDSGDDYDL